MNETKDKITLGLLIAVIALLLSLPFVWILVPIEAVRWAHIAVLIIAFGALMFRNRQSLSSRTTAFGIQSAVTILLIISLVGVVNFLAYKHPLKWDLTEAKVHTLSDQTQKLIKGLDTPVKATFFTQLPTNEKYRSLLDNYKELNTEKFQIEYINPFKAPTRARAEGIQQVDTLLLQVGEKKAKIDEPDEEKITNQLLKLTQSGTQLICATVGHGEHDFKSREAEGFDAARAAIEEQAYQFKEIKTAELQAIPKECQIVMVLGPEKAFFDAEIKQIQAFLNDGGRVFIGLDYDIRRQQVDPGITATLKQWQIEPINKMVVDPSLQQLNLAASVVPLATLSKDHAITNVFKVKTQNDLIYFPFMIPFKTTETPPVGMNVVWLGKTTPLSWAEGDIAGLKQEKATPGGANDVKGPLIAAVAVEGKLKDSKASKNSRLIVLGSSSFANNNFIRYGHNEDFFLNSLIWLMEDEKLISIRAKEEDPGKLDLTQDAALVVFWLAVIIFPVLVAGTGFIVWRKRRRL